MAESPATCMKSLTVSGHDAARHCMARAVMLALQTPCKVSVVRIKLRLPRMPCPVLIWQQVCTDTLPNLIIALLDVQASHLNG